MRRFRVRPDSIERKLRHERPQPTDDLIQRISASIGSPAPRTRWNFAVAFAVTVAIFTAFALTGGVSYASSAAQKGARAVSHVAFSQHSTRAAKSHSKSDENRSGKSHENSKSHESGKKSEKGGKRGNDEHGNNNNNNGSHGDDHGDDDDNDDDEADDDQYREKVLICHHPGKHQHTLRVPQSAVAAHLAHGDTLGACPKKKKHDDDD